MFSPYNLWFFEKGGSGVDIHNLKEQGTPLIGLVTDPQRYFDYHHSGNDTFEHVNKDHLNQGSATLASLIYLVDQHGLE